MTMIIICTSVICTSDLSTGYAFCPIVTHDNLRTIASIQDVGNPTYVQGFLVSDKGLRTLEELELTIHHIPNNLGFTSMDRPSSGIFKTEMVNNNNNYTIECNYRINLPEQFDWWNFILEGALDKDRYLRKVITNENASNQNNDSVTKKSSVTKRIKKNKNKRRTRSLQ